MGPATELPGSSPPEIGFSVFHQKVELDIDFELKRVKGRTEIIIIPNSKDLRTLRLNCRQCTLTRINVNSKGPTLKYSDPYRRIKVFESATAHQYHQVQRHLEPIIKYPPDEELVVNLPRAIRIEDNHVEDLNVAYAPITISVEFVVDRYRDGIHFVGCDESDNRFPHVYTKNTITPGSACCLFPCVDNLISRSTWDISINCPKTVGDALHRVGVPKDNDSETMRDEDHSDEEDGLEMLVVCSGEVTDEIPDPLNPRRKIVSFNCMNPVAARHIGFAIGPFENVNLTIFREAEDDQKLGSKAQKLNGFCLPGKSKELENTCIPLAKAMDFFYLTYGSYPFESYQLCFVDDAVADTTEAAGFSICSNRLLFPEEIIEPLERNTRKLVYSLASQWIGVDILPAERTDLWLIVGIAYYITDKFMEKLCGRNQYRFWQKKSADRICELDVERPSIHAIGALLDLDQAELDFLQLKAPMVVFILDNRMEKKMSIVITRTFLSAKLGDLPDGSLSTARFRRTCEKSADNAYGKKLDSFFDQWIYGAGCPRFDLTQSFNKKKLRIDLNITQRQSEQTIPDLQRSTFMRDVREDLNHIDAGELLQAFTGNVTVRIHEADGTPYDHIIAIEQMAESPSITYNTKYRRLKRGRKPKERATTAANTDRDAAGEGQDAAFIHCFGDMLQSDEEIEEWKLSDWSADDLARMDGLSFEWIRFDTEFEWICQLKTNMDPSMYLSQLQQDRDVVAQYETIKYIASVRETSFTSTILIRTLLDSRYHHGIRTEAARTLARTATGDLDWVGLFHLEKAFHKFFCYGQSSLTKPNDFSDQIAYRIQCAIPQAVALVRDHRGRAPLRAQRFLLDQLKLNDNTNNEFSDCHYVAMLMTALSQSLVARGRIDFYDISDDVAAEERKLRSDAIEEFDRYRRMDEWICSYQNVLSITALQCKQRLVQAGLVKLNLTDYFQYTRVGTFDLLRLEAFRILLELGRIENDIVTGYILHVVGCDPSPFIRTQMLRIFGLGLASVALGDVAGFESARPGQDELIIEGEDTAAEARRADNRRTKTVEGALEALRESLEHNESLKKALWEATTSRIIGISGILYLLDICHLLYEPITSLVVKLRYPHYYAVEHLGHGKLRFRWTEHIRSTQLPPPWVPLRKSPTSSDGPDPPAKGPTKVIFTSKPKPPASVGTLATTAATVGSRGSGSGSGKPKLTLKLKLG